MDNISHQLLQQTIDQLRQQLNVEFVGLALDSQNPQTHRKEIRWTCVSGNSNQRYQKIVLQVGHGLGGIVWRTGRRLLEHDLTLKSAEERLAYPISLTENLQSVVVEPVARDEQILAVLLVGFRQPNQLSEELLKSLPAAASRLATVLMEQEGELSNDQSKQ